MTSGDLLPSDSSSDETCLQDKWPVRRILAEAKVQGEIKYLIDWEGFDLCDATWEPAAHLSKGLLADWLATTKQTGKKTVSGFNIDQWRQAVNDDIRAKFAKEEEKNQQRVRLGLEQSRLDYTLEEWINSIQGPSEDESKDRNEDPTQNESSDHDLSSAADESADADSRTVGQKQCNKIKEKPEERKARRSFGESKGSQEKRPLLMKEGLALQREYNTSSNPPESPQESTKNQKKSPLQAVQAGLCAQCSLKITPGPTFKSKGAPNQPESSQKTAVNGIPCRTPAIDTALMSNVFIGGKKRKPRQNLLDAVSDASRSSKFLNHHKRRLIEKGLRDKEGVTPPSQAGNKFPAVHPIQTTIQPISTTPESGQNQGILVATSSLDHDIPKSKAKKKRVHWENDLCQKPQPQAELESLFVADEPSLVAESPSEGILSLSPARLTPTCDRSTISKACQFGNPEGLFTTLEFRDLTLENKPSWSCCFEGSDRLVFCHVCTIHDLLSQTACGTLKELSLCQGTISCSDMEKNVAISVVKRLQLGCFGAACYQNDFCILVFCSSFLDWTDASHDLVCSPYGDLGLGFLIFKPNILFTKSMLAPINTISSKVPDFIPDSLGAFDFFLGTTYKDLFGRTDDNATNNFFLVFPLSHHQEAVLISQWLRESKANCNVKSSLQRGQWSNFLTLDSSIVIFHEEVLWTIPSLPNISKILHSPSWNLKCFVLSPSGEFGQNIQQFNHISPIKGNYRLTQVFSQGTVILLTPSFIVSQPEQTYNFLKWFWQHYVDHGSKNGPGRLAVCSDICDWLFDLSQSKGKTGGSEQCRLGNSATEKVVQALLRCCNLIEYITRESEHFEEGPLVYAPDVLDGNDEQSLVNWFGSWAMLHIQQFKKFLVLGSSYQTEARLSRVIRPVQFITCCTEHLSPQDPLAIQTSQSGEDRVITEAMLAAKTGEFLTDINKSHGDLGFSPLVLYRFPISYWDPGAISQLGDCNSYFKDYDDWFNDFKEPFFSRAIGFSSKNMLPNYKNTYLGLFYTTDKKRSSAYSSSPQGLIQSLRPWIAIYRPVEIHTRPWKSMELLIWDPYIRNSVPQSNDYYEGELLLAQERLFGYIMDRSQDSKTMFPLERVWVGPFDDHQDDGIVDPFDCVLSWIKTISSLVKQRLPLSGKHLLSRGWKKVDLEASLTRATGSNVPRMIPETLPDNRPSFPLRTVFPAPKPSTGARASLRCNNRLQEAMLRHKGTSEISFTFQPTLKWYNEQVAAGRGLQHVKVTDWQTFFSQYRIHNPED